VPPSGDTLIVYSAVSPGCTDEATTPTSMQISVGVGVDAGADAFVPDEDAVPVPELVPPGVTGGLVDGGVVGGAGSTWHWLPELLTEACEFASAAAVVPAHTTATPANTANTVDPPRVPRCGMPGPDPSLGMILRFSIIG
jgi:hypothetical protein